MLLVGLTGAIGHGKTTLAEALQLAQPSTISLETGQLVAKVANAWLSALPEPLDATNLVNLNQSIKLLIPIIQVVLGQAVSEADLQIDQQLIRQHPDEVAKLFEYCQKITESPKLQRQVITVDNKEQHRALLQWLGGFLVQHAGAGIWFNQLVREAQQAGRAGTKLAIVPGVRFATDAKIITQSKGLVVLVSRPQLGEADIDDPTERQRNQIVPDCTVVNNGSIDQLNSLARQLHAELASGNLQKAYAANNY